MLIKSWRRNYAPHVTLIVVLQAGFVVAKLEGILDWHWLLVFAPVLLTATIFAVFLFTAMVIMTSSDERR
ncbi:hypothetical protein LCGC14_2573240 [marine sediment metagenome]|uniref:Uncharacterized protein n=1 Tax=marine sediment metagenome TaxID=412755 RepID=A0A0F9CSU8_9ZZZZ